MSRNLSLYLNDIVKSVSKIKRYTLNMTFDDFVVNEQVIDAVVFNLQIIGEAVKNIPFEIRNKYPQIDWRKIAGLRDVIAHTYFILDREIAWDIVQNKIDELDRVVKKIILEQIN